MDIYFIQMSNFILQLAAVFFCKCNSNLGLRGRKPMNITIIFTALFSGLVNIVFTFFFAVCLAYAAWYFINYRKLNADLLLAIEILEKYRNAGDEKDEDVSAQGSL